MGSPEERDHSSCCFETEHVVAREREARCQQAEQAGQGRLSIQAPSTVSSGHLTSPCHTAGLDMPTRRRGEDLEPRHLP